MAQALALAVFHQRAGLTQGLDPPLHDGGRGDPFLRPDRTPYSTTMPPGAAAFARRSTRGPPMESSVMRAPLPRVIAAIWPT
jgi:hypothetical protein